MAELTGDSVSLSEEARAAVTREVAAYNGEQAAVAADRIRRLWLFILPTIAATLVLAFLASSLDPDDGWLSGFNVAIYMFGALATFFAWDIAEKPAKRLQQGLRDRILPPVFSFLDGVTYANGVTPRSAESLPKAAIGTYNRTTIGDVVSGTLDGVPIEVFEATYRHKAGKSETVAFRGLVVGTALAKPFPSTLVALRRSGDVTRWFREMFSSGMATIDFTNPAIAEAFEVRAGDETAARRLVDGTLAKALAFLRDAWPEGQPRLALNGDFGFILLPTFRDFFELPKIGTPIDVGGHIEPMSAELGRLVSLARLVSRIA